MADIIIEKLYKQPVFSWGATNLSSEGDTRKAYLKAVKIAIKAITVCCWRLPDHKVSQPPISIQ